ncbi:MAG: cell division protein ZapA [Cytophagaceae bacterium]
MGELSIKIKIADREYPMRVDASEEERLRIAGRMINEKMRSYREQFGIDDKQDLLAMVAFECLAESMKSEKETSEFRFDIGSRLAQLEQILSQKR